MAKSELHVLHLSDTQFGRFHIFGDPKLSKADGHFDSLTFRLLDDLTKLHSEEGISPNLVVVSGDVTEWALKEEFTEAQHRFQLLLEQLSLGPDQLMVVPGNHDINRPLCQAYFLTCQGRGIDPVEPFVAKWETFFDFYSSIFGADAVSEERPWALRPFEPLGLVVACLNSTMRESHRDEDHYGWIGEDQLRWFQKELETYDDSWWRIAVVHHNVQRGAQRDDENLRDSDDFESILGDKIDVVLHGHTHNGRVARWGNGVPILSTGSAAVAASARPAEVPNQYQVLQLSENTIRLLCRRYEPDLSRWVGDTRVTQLGDDWRLTIPVRLAAPTTPAIAPVEPESDQKTEDTYIKTTLDETELIRHMVDLRPEVAAMLPPNATPDDFIQCFGLVAHGEFKRSTVIMFALMPTTRIPSAMIQCVRYRGTDRTAYRDSQQMVGPARRQLEETLEFIRGRVSKRERPRSGEARASVSYDLPMIAVRECLANAVVHRDYTDEARHIHVRVFDDRLEIASPGAWVDHDLGPSEIPIADLISQSVKRNPELAFLFSQVRSFEGEGSGLPLAVEESAAMFAPPPTARSEDGFCIVTIRPAPLDSDLAARYIKGLSLAVEAGFAEFDGFGSRRRSRRLLEPISPTLRAAGGLVPWQSLIAPQTAGKPALVLGPPGSGKTTLAYLVLRAAVGRATDPGGPGLPVLIRAQDLKASWSDAVDWLARALSVRNDLSKFEAHEVVEAALSGARGLLIIDGLDELIEPDQISEVAARLDEIAAKHPTVRVIATSRPTKATPDGWSEYWVQPMRRSDVESFVSEHAEDLGLVSPGRFIKTIAAQPNLSELATVPLFMRMMVDIFGELSYFPANTASLLRELLRMTTSQWDRQRAIQRTRFSLADAEGLLGEIAWSAFRSGFSFHHVPRELARVAVMPAADYGSYGHNPDFLIDDLCAVGGIIRPTASGDAYEFVHRAFYEYLVANRMVLEGVAVQERLGLLINAPAVAGLYFQLSAQYDRGAGLKEVLDGAAALDTDELGDWIREALGPEDLTATSRVRSRVREWFVTTGLRNSRFAKNLEALVRPETE